MKKKDHPLRLIDAGSKASDVATSSPQMVRMNQTLGLPMGFGDITVGQLCERNGISAALYTTLGNMVLNPLYKPDIDCLDQRDVRVILRYLKSSHRLYRTVSLPQLHANVHKIAERCPEETKTMVNKFFDQYDAEMTRHIETEENDWADEKYLDQHSDVEVKLDDFKNIIVKYVPESCDIPERYVAVIQIMHIATELNFHTRIEEQLLYPLTLKFEKKDLDDER